MATIGLKVNQTQALLAAVGIGGLAIAYLLFKPASAQPPPPNTNADAVTLTVSPTSVVAGTGVSANATFTRQGTPVAVPIAYMRVMMGTVQVGNTFSQNNVSSISNNIDTTALAAGTYIVEVSDNSAFQ